MKSKIKLKTILFESQDVNETFAHAGLKGYFTGAVGTFLLSLFGDDKKQQIAKIQKEFGHFIDNKIKNDPEFKSILDKIKSGNTSIDDLEK